MLCDSLVVGVRARCLWWPLCWVWCRPDGEGCMGLTFYLANFFPVKPQLCIADANCLNPYFILFYFIFFLFFFILFYFILFYVKSCLFSL